LKTIVATAEYGIVVRMDSLHERGVTYQSLLEALEVSAPLDVDEQIASFGPSFGEEALNEFVRRLTALGLEVFDDFFVISLDLPTWCSLRVGFVPMIGR